MPTVAARDVAQVQRIAVIGTGLIGTGWVALFLQRGFKVSAWDPAPQFAAQLRKRLGAIFTRLDLAAPQQARLFDALHLAESAAGAVDGADFVQENGPEKLAAKRAILHELAVIAAPDTVIASSSSGLRMSELQQGCDTAYRLVVGHPFHPVYLLPLVEVVGGEETAPDVVSSAAALYRRAGQSPVICNRDNTGFIGNRLQEAMFREALHMIEAGEATAEQIDAVVTHGPGLRWAFMGPFLAYHLTGGDDGIRGFFERFGDSLLEPYSRLRAPALSEDLLEQVCGGIEQSYGGLSPTQLESWRDENLKRLLAALRSVTLAQHEEPESPAQQPGAFVRGGR
jgi:carnitine 3-dehydrogenase